MDKIFTLLTKLIYLYNYYNMFYYLSYKQVQWSTLGTAQAIAPYSE